ncbi:MAG: Ig-like domain-containing protein [Bacteroidota bacterium]|nr:Ig-like domain-containing protein [Bacteroidota bacterium]
MKSSLIKLIIPFLLLFGCKETVIENQIPKEFTNDLLHADLIGKIVQKDSKAKVIISQVAPIDSVEINPADGSFAFRDLRSGNYDVTIRSNNYRTFTRSSVQLTGGSIVYFGEIKLSTIPDQINSYYPEDNGEIVYDWRYGRITVSILFSDAMDRQSVEKAFSTDPKSEGVFYWGNYTQAPMKGFFSDSKTGFNLGATITTYSKVKSMTYSFAKKDSYPDTTYTITIGTTAKDTAGNYLRFPLKFKFSTVQSYSTLNGIQTSPVHGDIDVAPLYNTGIIVTFPRRMNKSSVEAVTHVTPQMPTMFLWPDENQLKIYTGGPFLSDTLISVSIDSMALDKDGIAMGHQFNFSFRTAPFTIDYTSPSNGQVFASMTDPIRMDFNNYVILSSAQSAFSISPAATGTISYGGYPPYETVNEIKFTPSVPLQANTKYTVTVSPDVKDMHGVKMKAPYSFSFVTRPY